MPISMLPQLKVGDIWQDGKLFSSPADTQTFADLLITSNTVKAIKAGVELDGAFLLPFEHHPLHRHHTQSYCLIIKVNQNTQFVIPCTEMIRFYWGSSGFLLQLLFTRPFNEKSFWLSKHFDPDTSHLHLKLADSISSACATDIGRMAMSDFARTCVARVFDSCVKASSTNQSVYPYMGFPFTGKTSLTAHGVWLPSDNTMRTFVAHRLVSCTHSHPFSSLTYELGRFKYQIQQQHEAMQASTERRRSSISRNQRKQTQTDEDPGTKKAVKSFSVPPSVRFPDLLRKSVWHKEIQTPGAQMAYIQREDGSLEKVAFGLPEGAGDARALETRNTQKRIAPEKAENLPKFVMQGVKQIDQQYGPFRLGKTRNLIILAGHSSPLFSLPVLIDQYGEISAVTQFTEPNGTHRPRQACFVEIRNILFRVKTLVVLEGQNIREKPGVFEAKRAEQESLLEVLRG